MRLKEEKALEVKRKTSEEDRRKGLKRDEVKRKKRSIVRNKCEIARQILRQRSRKSSFERRL